MTYPTIVLKANATQYSKLVNLGNTVVTGLSGNLNFLSPAITVLSLSTAVTNLVLAIGVWGPKNNRGSHATLVDLKQKALTLHNLLKAEADYVQTQATIAAGNDYTLMATIIASSGFSIMASKHNQGVLSTVQHFGFMASGSLNRNQVKMVWAKPLDVTTPTNVRGYNVYRSATNSFAGAVQINTVVKAEFIDTNNTGATVTWFYFVAAVGSAGQGAVSTPITVTLLPA